MEGDWQRVQQQGHIAYVSPPGDLVGPRVGPDVALEIHVVPLLDVGPVERGPEGEDGLGDV